MHLRGYLSICSNKPPGIFGVDTIKFQGLLFSDVYFTNMAYVLLI
jgi:hypothetical protein